MEFPKDNAKLNEIFKKGSDFDPEEYNGNEYWVDILTGSMPSYRWAGHKKRFFKNEAGEQVGRNYVLKFFGFGYFNVEKGICDDFENLDVVILDYGHKRNLFFRNMRDRLRKIEDDVFLGRYCMLDGEQLNFEGYFTMIKKQRGKKK